MGNLIRIALLFFVFYMLLRLLGGLFGVRTKASKRPQESTGNKKEKKSVLDRLGDYIDYEEVKEKEK